MVKRYILFEHAIGYSIFKIISHEEVGTLLSTVQESIAEIDRFGKVSKLFAYYPFKTAESSLSNISLLSEGLLPEELEEFLRSNVKVSSKVTLGVSDPKLASLIHEKTGINCVINDAVTEIIRGIRMHFHKMINSIPLKCLKAAQIGLGHSLSRLKIKYNAQKSDNMIMQACALIDQLDKDINTFSQRIREWYSYHFPELYKILKDNLLFAKGVKIIGDRKNLDENLINKLDEELLIDGIGMKIYNGAQTSLGMDIAEIDMINIKSFCDRVIDLINYRNNLHEYLLKKMNLIAPNLSSIAGEMVGARLISQAGSLLKLAKCPASTVQILGAEKSLFRALKTRGRTPKYGIIYHNSFIGRAPSKYKGRISRLVAHKCSIASRLDSFSEFPCSIIGEKMSEQIEERLQYFFKGEPENEEPKRNNEVMADAVKALKEYQANQTCVKKSKKKTKKTCKLE